MFKRKRTPFSSMICETVWISVVERTGSSGVSRPFESIRWEAKMVLIKVDFPRPVCPRKFCEILWYRSMHRQTHTNTDDIKLEPSLQQFALNLLCDTVETDMAAWKDSIYHCLGHDEGRL